MARDRAQARGVRALAPPALATLVLAGLGALWTDLAPALAMPVGSSVVRYGQMVLDALAILAGAWLVIRVVDVLLWHGLVQRRSGRPAPRLLVDLCAALVWIGALILVLALALRVEVVGIVATSSVLLAVIGFALRDIIASLFAGIALSLERPYGIGDWIEVEPGTVARVEQISWLTTRATSKDGINVVVPNARLTNLIWRNYSRPQAAWRDSIRVPVDYDVAAERVEQVLLAALLDVPAVDQAEQPPDVKIAEFGERGSVWLARYWVTDYGVLQDVRFLVQKSILRHLHYAGIEIARPRMDAYERQLPPPPRDQAELVERLLAECELFRTLDAAHRARIAATARRVACPRDVAVVREGEPGSSMFVVGQGLFRVSVRLGDGTTVPVNAIGPGGMFGEFSLLTGAPRSATVVPAVDGVLYEIAKEDVAALLAECPDVARDLSHILDERQARSRNLLSGGASREDRDDDEGSVLDRLRAFFGLS
ncbi:MAG: mechanosensitive ion channel [Geminicoccaceae bacterium]